MVKSVLSPDQCLGAELLTLASSSSRTRWFCWSNKIIMDGMVDLFRKLLRLSRAIAPASWGNRTTTGFREGFRSSELLRLWYSSFIVLRVRWRWFLEGWISTLCAEVGLRATSLTRISLFFQSFKRDEEPIQGYRSGFVDSCRTEKPVKVGFRRQPLLTRVNKDRSEIRYTRRAALALSLSASIRWWSSRARWK